ncbi:MAG TPA: 6-phosphogluconolactonase [Clostridia bacterium]|nr:6-phosphogluconolactonase [Clostridia bacterium]
MNIIVCENAEELGEKAAELAAEHLHKQIKRNGSARIIVSTGASQFDTFRALIASDIEWNKVEMFHLDEYFGLAESHPASFRKYLKERFVSKVNLLGVNFVEGTAENIQEVSKKLLEKPVDLGIIGIGENAHIAFNDPPADFETTDPYILVNLDEACKKQQVGEGWFATIDDVPKQAVTMSVHQILQCKKIISCVPYAVKAKAVAATVNNDTDNQIPATILKTHKDWTLLLDKDSAALL